jgi:hypothetical protein
MYRSTCAHLSFFFKAISAQMLLRPARSTWVHCVRSVQGYLYHLLWHEFIVFTVYLATCATCFDKSSLCTLCTGLPVPPASTRVHYVRCVQGYLCHLLQIHSGRLCGGCGAQTAAKSLPSSLLRVQTLSGTHSNLLKPIGDNHWNYAIQWECLSQELLVDLTYCVHEDSLYCERHYAEK